MNRLTLSLFLFLGMARITHAVPDSRQTRVNRLEIPAHCEASYDRGVALYGETMSLPTRARQTAAWKKAIAEETDESCQVMLSQALLDAEVGLTRELAIHYWLDVEAARNDAAAAKLEPILKAEARAAFEQHHLNPEQLEDGGLYAFDGELERSSLPRLVAYWKEQARVSGRAQFYYRFLFTTGGLLRSGYSVYDFARDERGRKRYDRDGKPIQVEGSYGRAIRQIVEYAKAVLRDYDDHRPTFLQRIFDVNFSFYAGSFSWHRPQKLARELREEEYPRQMEAYLNMARGLNLRSEDLRVFYDLYRDLLKAQSVNLAADDHALEKVQRFAVGIAEFGGAILTGGEGLAVMYPKLGVQGAEALMLFSSLATELLGSQVVTQLRAHEWEKLHGKKLDWATYLDTSVESAMDFLPVATLVPTAILGTAQVGEVALVSGPRLLSSLGEGVGGWNLADSLASLRGMPKTLWLNWWENRAMLRAGPKIIVVFSGLQVLHHSLDGGDHRQMATSILYSALGTFFSPAMVNSKTIGSRFVLNNLIVLLSSFLAQEAVTQHFDWGRTKVDLGFSAGFSFWVLQGNRRVLRGIPNDSLGVKRQELVWLSLQFLKALNVDNSMKDLMLSWYKKGPSSAPLVRAYLRKTYALDLDAIPDADLDAGARQFLQYDGIPADTGI